MACWAFWQMASAGSLAMTRPSARAAWKAAGPRAGRAGKSKAMTLLAIILRPARGTQWNLQKVQRSAARGNSQQAIRLPCQIAIPTSHGGQSSALQPTKRAGLLGKVTCGDACRIAQPSATALHAHAAAAQAG